MKQQDHPEVTVVSELNPDWVRTLQTRSGKDIWLFGGSELFRSFLAKNPRRAGQKGKELRFLHGAIKWVVHARRQVGREYQWCILREPVF
jgi:hypothetical protein